MRHDHLSLRQRLGLEAHRLMKKSAARQHPLSFLFWECTLRCNLACAHCGSDCRKDMRQQDMPLADFLRALDSITPHVEPNKTMIGITGGEPLMRDDLAECGAELYRRGYPWGIVTNGLYLTRERLDSLMNAGLRAVTISLDGMEAAHNRLRGKRDSFAAAVRGIEALVALGDDVKFDIVTCVTPYNSGQLAELRDFLIGLGVAEWRVFTVFPIGRAATNSDLQLSPTAFRQLLDFIVETRQAGQIKLDYGCEGFLGSYEGRVRDNLFFCQAGVTVGSILVDGSISACPNLRAKFTQGNIYTDDFMTVWNKRYQAFRDRSWMLADDCASRRQFRYCEGNGMHLRDENGKLLFCHYQRLAAADAINPSQASL